MGFAYIILFLHFFIQGTGVGLGGAKFTFANNCSEIIWPAILGQKTIQATGFVLAPYSSVAVQVPSTGWNGRVWGRTGCAFGAEGDGFCATGDCGQLECKTNASAATLVKLSLGNVNSVDFYDISVVDGFNLPLLLEPSKRAQCRSLSCAEDINQICPLELRIDGIRACRGACEVFNTSEYCCTGTARCGPTTYSRVFKEACPDAYSYPQDDATFICSGGGDYFITFCPTSLVQIGNGMPPAYSPQPMSHPQTPAYSPQPISHSPTANGKKHSKVIIIGCKSENGDLGRY